MSAISAMCKYTLSYWLQELGPWLNIKMSYQYRKSHCDHLISTIDNPILVRRHIYIESAPRCKGKLCHVKWNQKLLCLGPDGLPRCYFITLQTKHIDVESHVTLSAMLTLLSILRVWPWVPENLPPVLGLLQTFVVHDSMYITVISNGYSRLVIKIEAKNEISDSLIYCIIWQVMALDTKVIRMQSCYNMVTFH